MMSENDQNEDKSKRVDMFAVDLRDPGACFLRSSSVCAIML